MTMQVPFVDLRAQQQEIAEEVAPVLLEILGTGAFVGGPPVAEFEQAYASFSGTAHCVGVGNGTDAVELALRGAGVQAGDEVLVPANTFIATAEAVSRIGAVPVPVDVDDEHLLIDPARVAEAVTGRTRAIVPVHLFGQVAPVEALTGTAAAAGAAIVEDAAQSHGATRNGRKAGALGSVAATSFYPGKNLGASGDAGAVTTDDDAIAHRVRLLRDHGSVVKYRHEVVGMNSRLDALHAVTLRAKLARLPEWNARRRAAADRYAALLDGVEGVRVPRSQPGNEDVWHLYVVRVRDRDRVLAALQAAGVGAGLHYPVPWHRTEAYAELGHGAGTCPVAERAAGEILSLPMFPHITAEQQQHVVEQLSLAVAGG